MATIKQFPLENFTNNTIDLNRLPRFEDVQMTALHPSYWQVILAHIVIFFAIIGAGMIGMLLFVSELSGMELGFSIAYLVVLILTILLSRISFMKKGFAFREHDVLYRSGIIATSTIVIPYNRIQHVAMHEGWISRIFGLAAIAIFTAGGSSSDISIPGIRKEQAEDIKQLLMGKIRKQL
jgi:membrane protein YdbS with pleckstrin-like domain